MKLQFKDLRVGDVLQDNSGFKTDKPTIKVKGIHKDQISTEGYYGSYTKDYLELNFEFVKRTKFEVGDKVRLQRSTKNPNCEWNFSFEMKTAEKYKTELEITESLGNHYRVTCPEWTVRAEQRHIIPVFESEEKLDLSNSEETLDSRIKVLEEKLRDMTKYEKELEELKLARKILSKYM